MRKYLLAIAMMCCFAACDSGKNQSQRSDVISEEEEFDTDYSSDDADTSRAYTRADGLFDDFIYRFMQDSLLQRKRIDFPLTYLKDGEKNSVEESSWIYDSIYSSAKEYSVIYDGREAVESNCDSLVKKATVEVVDLKKERVKMYNFFRVGQYWKLRSIDEHFLDHDNNHAFFSFYSQFANNEDFQREHVHDPFYFKTYDSDNFQEIEGWVSADLWSDYRTYLPSEQLFNTIYDDVRPMSAYRTFVIGSPSSGMVCTLLFKRTNDRWELVRMEN